MWKPRMIWIIGFPYNERNENKNVSTWNHRNYLFAICVDERRRRRNDGWSKYGTVKSAPSMLTSTQSKPKPKTQPIKPAAKRPWNMTATVAIENRFLKFYSLYRTKHNEFGLSLLQRHFITKANFIELVFWIEEKATNFYVPNDL